MAHYQVTAFYKFVDLDDPGSIRQMLEARGRELGIIGTILLAGEGINSTIAGVGSRLDNFMEDVRSLPFFRDLEEKRSTAEEAPFYRFKVRVKKEIVTLGVPGADPRNAVGTYVEPQEWRALVEAPDTVLIDTRNDYEVAMGKFKGALNPGTRSFREFPEWMELHVKNASGKKVAMYCTGGIRCEKATSFLKLMGYDKVYHLKGGILKYLETVEPADSIWEGDCFVFDQRVGLQHGLQRGDYELCRGCRHPLSSEDREDSRFEPGVTCPYCAGEVPAEKLSRLRERQKQVNLATARGLRHIGADAQYHRKSDDA